ncbi:rCG26845 [Rattus norvegicus]|uniref:RCG26845 n=1 Tax=Rattus norvegicus TaxID=10116 RepID=A6HNL3_RAT|nr:rCG26845 [Rattus norvegicus]
MPLIVKSTLRIEKKGSQSKRLAVGRLGRSGPPVSTLTYWYFFSMKNIRVGLPVTIKSTNVALLGVPETEPLTKEQVWAGAAPLPTHRQQIYN